MDVSSYQGEVDWPVLAEQGVDFAFIKATEGSLLQDRRFAANWAGAAAAGVRAGAYHFLSYDSPGETQADNFIAAVPVTEGALPPVVDIEFYGEYLDTPPEKERVRDILDPLLERLEEHYETFLRTGSFTAMLEDYRKHCITLGKEVHVLGREPFFAEALDITPEGELLVRRADNGKEEVVFSGEVSIRGVI